MNLRKLEHDAIITATTKAGSADILVSDRPDAFDPAITVNRIVVMPERAIVNIIANPDNAEAQRPTINALANKLLTEVVAECGDDCKAEVDTFNAEVPEIGMEVSSDGVVCQNAGDCGSCPIGIREQL